MPERTTLPAVAVITRDDAHGAERVVERTLRRVAATEPVVHAYTHVDGDGARAAARALDHGRGERGSLHGAPFAVKDVLAVSGMAASCGCRALADRVSTRDAAVVRSLRAAGAILVGKHTMHELACGLDEPATRNPWDLPRYPGGSSAGGGVSVAVGSSCFALGTDAAGSVRIPAAMTGVVGLKPTHGLVSVDGVVREASAPSIDHVGILAATVADAALVLATIATQDKGGDGHEGVRQDPLEALDTGVDGLRIGILDAGMLAEVESDVQRLVSDACAELGRCGASLVPVGLPILEQAGEAVSTIFAAELAAGNERLLGERGDAYHRGVRALLERGLRLPTAELEEADRVRSAIREGLADLFVSSRLDALVSPTVARSAMPLAALDPSADLAGLIAFTCPFNLTGQPAMSVPCGFTPTGLPAGLQVVGARFDEATVLRIGAAYQSVTGWHQRATPDHRERSPDEHPHHDPHRRRARGDRPLQPGGRLRRAALLLWRPAA